MSTNTKSSARHHEQRGWSQAPPSSTLAVMALCIAVLATAVEPVGSASADQLRYNSRSGRQRSVLWPAEFIRRLRLPIDEKSQWPIAYDERLQQDDDRGDDVAAVAGAVRSWWPSDTAYKLAPDSIITSEKRQPYHVPDLCRHVCDLCHKKMSLTVSSLCPDQCVIGSGRHYEVCHAMWQLKLL